MLRTSLCTVSRQSARAVAAAPSSNVELLRFQQIWSSSWTRLLTCPSLCSSVLGSIRKQWRFRSCSSSTGDVAAWAARWNFWTNFLLPLSGSPSCGGPASVLEAFGRSSQYFPSWPCRATFVRLWIHILHQLVDGFGRISYFLRCWVDSVPEVVSSLLLVATLVVNNGSGMPGYILFDSGIQFGRAFAVFSRFRLMTMMKGW